MILELCKGVHCVDLGESFQTHICLQNLISIQPRTSPAKFAASGIDARAVDLHAARAGRPVGHGRRGGGGVRAGEPDAPAGRLGSSFFGGMDSKSCAKEGIV